MLSKKRQILFDVLGERTRKARAPGFDPRILAAPKPRLPRGAPSRRAVAIWGGASALLVVAVVAGLLSTRDPGTAAPVLLHRGAKEPAAETPPAARTGAEAQKYAVCALSLDYKSRAERKVVAEKIQETVNFLGYHPDPDFRDVRGEPGQDPESGTFRVYVGSARSRSELIPLRNKLAMVERKRARPFQNASVRLVDAASAKETSR